MADRIYFLQEKQTVAVCSGEQRIVDLKFQSFFGDISVIFDKPLDFDYILEVPQQQT